MTLSTITLNAIDYVSNASVAEADAYLAIDPVRGGPWALLSVDEKGAFLVSGTRRLNPLSWEGTKTNGEGTQVDAFPRTGVTYDDGTEVSTTEVPVEVENATILTAGSTAIDPTVSGAGTSGSNNKKLKAGSAEIEYFRAEKGKPLQDEMAWDLIKQFMDIGLSANTGMYAPGTSDECGVSSFDNDQMGFDLNGGFS